VASQEPMSLPVFSGRNLAGRNFVRAWSAYPHVRATCLYFYVRLLVWVGEGTHGHHRQLWW